MRTIPVKTFKTFTPIFIALILTIATFLLIPITDVIIYDNSMEYPFFYAKALSPIYYLAIIYSAFLALFCKKEHIKLVSLLCIALLVELTPSLMLVNPWLPDQYPYLSEPVFLIKNARIAPVHYLYEVPGLGLTFSQFMLITNLDAYTVSKLYPILVVLMLVLPTFLISREICGNGAIAPLLFLAVNSTQINTFHRFSLFFMLFSLVLLLLWRLHGESKSVYLMTYMVVFSASTLVYPGSIIIPFMLLLSSGIWFVLKRTRTFQLFRKLEQPITEPIHIYKLGLISLMIFFLWNIFMASESFTDIIELIQNALAELASPEDPFRILTPVHTSIGTVPTTVFMYILWIRMAFTIVLQGLAFLSLILSMFGKSKGNLIIHALYLPLFASYALYLPTSLNQYYLVRASLYATFLSSLCVTILWNQKRGRVVRTMIVLLIAAGLVLIPITRYASLPYLHVTTQELSAAVFVHQFYASDQPICYTEYPPYIRVIVGKNPDWEFTQCFMTSEHDSDFSAVGVVISKRQLTRDGYYLFLKPVSIMVTNVTKTLSLTSNLVYANGYTNLFMKN